MNRVLPRARRAQPEAGFGLVESMIVVLIILFMSLAIYSVMASNEANKRTTTSVSDANQEGNYALYVLDKAIRSAGSGFRQDKADIYGCLAYASLSGAQLLPATAANLPTMFQQVNTDLAGKFRIAPIMIDKNASPTGTSDVLIVMSGTSGYGEYPQNLALPPSSVTGASATLNLQGTVGFNASDMLLMAVPNASGAPQSCVIEEVAPTFNQSGSTAALPLAGNYYTTGPASALLSSMTALNKVMNLGNEFSPDGHPSFQLFGVAKGGTTTSTTSSDQTLYSYDLLQVQTGGVPSTTPTALADGVLEMHAIYGIAANTTCPCPITAWVDPGTAPWNLATLTKGDANANNELYQIKAVRIGLILRTSLPEKTAVASVPVTLFRDLNPASPGVAYTRTFTAAEQLYRYRTVEVTIPLRDNML